MTSEELEKRRQRAINESLVVAITEKGFKVYAPANPSKQYIVTGDRDSPICTCPDFQHNKEDLDWRCKHIIAAFDLGRSAKQNGQMAEALVASAGAKPQPESGQPTAEDPEVRKQNSHPSQMLLKRSVSPDGRIDSLSVEFASPVDGLLSKDIKARSEKILWLQDVIVHDFLSGNGMTGNGRQASSAKTEANGAVSATLVNVAGMNSRWGRRLFINVQANGKTVKLFGKREDLAEAIVSAGYPYSVENIDEGVSLNLPCRVTLKPSKDGRYLNVDQVIPTGRSQRAERGR